MVQFRQKKTIKEGFTIIELMVVIAIVSIVAALAVPSLTTMMKDYRLKSAVRKLVSDLQEMKLRAVKENAITVLLISEPNDNYTVFVDNNPGNWALDASEPVISQVNLRNDDLEIETTSVSDTLGFNSRGMISAGAGTITISNSAGRQKQIVINLMGGIRVE